MTARRRFARGEQMAKQKTAYICADCGFEAAKWSGMCPACRAYNTMEEYTKKTETPRAIGAGATAARQPIRGTKAIVVAKARSGEDCRLMTNIGELDRVLGGGLTKGSIALVGGEPGIGKSTLLLQICKTYCYEDGKPILYVSGEESNAQIKSRATRIGIDSENLYLLAETDISEVISEVDALSPSIVIIDSIQTMFLPDVSSSPGNVTQIRECANVLMGLAKGRGVCVFIVGHVTKEGTLAGPRVLEHMVDTVLYFEGERSASYRVIRAVKNRYGATDEVGVFEMTSEGLVGVDNPSAYMLSGRPIGESGSCVTCAMEGSRAILAEVQALTVYTSFGMPRRSANGLDYNRVVMLIAALEKKAGIKLGTQDVYVNAAGGLRLTEPAIDMAVALAIASSSRNKPVGIGVCVFGEVGLSGEARLITALPRRVLEAARQGFDTIVVPRANLKGFTAPDGVRVLGVGGVAEMLAALL